MSRSGWLLKHHCRSVLAAALVPLLLLAAAGGATAATTKAVVANAGNPDSVTVYDFETGGVVTVTSPVLNTPRYVAITPNGRFAAVGNLNGNSIAWLNLRTNPPSFLPTVTNLGGQAKTIVLRESRGFVTVDGSSTDSVVTLDLTPLTNSPPTAPTVLTSVTLNGADPEGLAVTADNRFALVPMFSSGTLEVVDLVNGTSIGSTGLGAGSQPWAVAITNDGDRALVTTEGNDAVAVVDLNGLLQDPPVVPAAPMSSVVVGDGPRGIAISGDGSTAVVALFSGGIGTQAAVINLSDFATEHRTVGTGPFAVAITRAPTSDPEPGGRFLAFVSNGGTDNATILDLTPASEIDTLTVVGASNASPIQITTLTPHGLVTGQDVTVSGVVGNTAANGSFPVTVLDATSFLLIGSAGNGTYQGGGTVVPHPLSLTVALGDVPRGVAITRVRAPRARLEVAPRNGKIGTVFTFDGTESSDPDGTLEKFTFDFGDGSAPLTKVCADDPTCAVATYVYPQPGRYRPKLIVTDDDGVPSPAAGAGALTVNANRLPRAQFVAQPYRGGAPLTVNFVNRSSDPDGVLVAFCWNFGIGNPGCDSTEQNPTHVYTTPGRYEATLIATDDNGGVSNVFRRIIQVNPNRPPRALFAPRPYRGQAPLAVTFDDRSLDYDGQIVSYCWNFGIGNPGCDSTEQNPTHTYTTPGLYDAQLVVTDNAGDSSAPYTHRIDVR